MTIDLIIPIYKPDNSFVNFLKQITSQTIPINKVIVYNVEQKFYDRLLYNSRLGEYKNLEVRHIAKREFDAGKTRNQAVKQSDADYFLMMNQYAMPADGELISKLIAGIEAEPDIAIAYARQVLPDDAPEYEKYVARYYFGMDSATHSLKDVESLGRAAYMNSNGCALYRRDVFEKLGGFLNHVIANEDVLYASKVINEGYKVRYVSDAVVVNTAPVNASDHTKLSFDRAVSVAKHPETFNQAEIRAELKKIDKMVLNHLKRNGFRAECWEYKHVRKAMFKGFKRGLRYKSIASMDLPRFSANEQYWRMDEILRARSVVDVRAGYGRSEAELEMLNTPPVSGKKN